MSTHSRIGQIDGQWGTLYFFDDPGDGLGMHKHDAESSHGIRVIGGSIVVYGLHGAGLQSGRCGDVLNIEWGRFHEIRATSRHTAIFNFFLNGFPPSYVGLADEQLSGNTAQILTHDYFDDGSVRMKDEYLEHYS